jgi:hypothetical protein
MQVNIDWLRDLKWILRERRRNAEGERVGLDPAQCNLSTFPYNLETGD